MRRAAAIVVVSMLFVSFAAIAPAGATSPETCAGFAATLATKPALPVLSSKDKVKPTLTLTGRLSSCTGPEVGTGALSLMVKIGVAVNCGSTRPKTIKAIETINWSDGKSSSVSVVLPVFGGNQSLDGTVSSGALKNLHQAATLTGAAPNGTCTTKPLSSETLTLATHAKFVFE
jgi:hypothetical protein